ncbi:MAG: ATP-dependent DNA helicase RecG [Cyanobacteria bacterium P01_H01_bin.74]
MLTADEATLKLTAMNKALALEKQCRYSNVQGRHKTFAAFMTESLTLLTATFLTDAEQLTLLRRSFENYTYMDVGSRMGAIEQLEQFFLEKKRAKVNLQALRKRAGTRPGLNPESSDPVSTGHTGQETDHYYVRPALTLDSEVQFLKGVGPNLAKILANVGVFTIKQLLYYFPKRYIDYETRQKIIQLEAGQDVTIIGQIRSVSAYNTRSGQQSILSVLIEDDTGVMAGNWFLGKVSRAVQENHKSRYAKGTDVMVSGRIKWDTYKKIPAIDRPQIEILSYQDKHHTHASEGLPSSLHAGRIVPVYPLTEGLNLRFLRKAIHQALQSLQGQLQDSIPGAITHRLGLLPLAEALTQIHFPDSQQLAKQARERLVFDELFFMQLRLALMRQSFKQQVQGLILATQEGGLVQQFTAALPFQLTKAQKRVTGEILNDMAQPEPMYRLLQGDVGSGKTIVAMITLLVAVENGYQGALMAPTEILAEQHFKQCTQLLTPLGLRVGLFVGKNKTKIRRQLQQDLLNGQIHVAVGTHALIQNSVEFHRLGAVVVDEQHRFGVKQRTLLKEKGQHPEMLTMTATPIPRTLAMTMHGDLDVSLLDERPPGRSPIKTTLLKRAELPQAYQLIRHEILCGRQAYIVFPLIEESETLSARAATTEAERLQAEVFQTQRVGLLHGKMRPEEKEAVMAKFAAVEIDILVSTTVVEVGVDIPNATVMIIENADRFGLSQLHQLRGRVGRGQFQSYCMLVSESPSEETLQRLHIMTESEDGFYIAEKDLEIRGPGEYLGTRQSGLPDLILADLVEDRGMLEITKREAFALSEQENFKTEYKPLIEAVYQKTADSFSILGAG